MLNLFASLLEENKRRNANFPDAYPSIRHDQVTFAIDKYGEIHAPIEDMNLLPLILIAFEFGRFNGREQEQFAQVYDKVSNGFRINLPFGELNLRN